MFSPFLLMPLTNAVMVWSNVASEQVPGRIKDKHREFGSNWVPDPEMAMCSLQFGYLLNSALYTNSSDITDIYEMHMMK